MIRWQLYPVNYRFKMVTTLLCYIRFKAVA